MDRWTASDIPDQTGRLVVVTGANSGLGYEAARALALAGADVVLACRDTGKGGAAATRILADHPGAQLRVVRLDLADLTSVAEFAGELSDAAPRLDLLLNNAGLMALDASRTVDGFETQFGVNHLGHFALTARLLPLLLATAGSRVVTMSSMGHRSGRLRRDDTMFDQGYRRWDAYYQSKLANLLFTAELDRRLRARSATTASLAAHPGASRTDLGSEGRSLGNRAVSLLVQFVTQSPRRGALPLLRAATDPGALSGQYYGPAHRGWFGHPVLETPSDAARGTSDAAWLWAESERLTGVTALDSSGRVPSV